MSDIEITVTNPDGQVVKPVLVDPPGFDEYLDKPRRLTAKIEKGSGLDPQGTVSITRRGAIKLIGHVTKLDQSNAEHDALTLDSAEYLLDQRIGQFYRFPSGTTLNAMLASSMGGSVVGLLAMANSLIPRGSFVQFSGHIYMIVGAGTSSRFGTLTQLYQNATLLTKVSGVPTAAGQWYQSATDLYIWCSDSRSPDYHLIIAPNHKDTLVRLGNISLGTTTFTVCFEIGAAKLFPTIKALITAAGLEYTIRYEKDGYAYLDASATVGKGSSSEPVATYIDGKNAEITTGQMDGLGKLQALLGQGAGAGMVQQCAAAIDVTTRGTWREAVYQASGLFGSMLRTATSKVFSDCQDPTIYNVRVPEQDWSQAVGNYVGIVRSGYMPLVRRIKHIQMRSSGDMLLEVGQRLRTLQELLKADSEIQQILSSFYGAHTKNAWSWGLPETNIDSYDAISHQFLLASTDDSEKDPNDKTIGSGEIDPNFPFQVLLGLKIGWYTSSVYATTVNTDSHSSVGSHSGYGGTSTSSKPMTAHSVNAVTSIATGALLLLPYGEYNSYAGDHQHSVTVYSAGGHSHTVGASGTGYGSVSGSSCFVNVSVSGSAYYSGDHAHGGYASAPGNHHHNYTTSASLPTGGHAHELPAHYTNEAASQSHETQQEGAKTRAGSSAHPERDAIVTYLKSLQSTGSLKYITMAVKVNGVHVPGSPFSGNGGTGLYIGDSVENLDISSLVTVGSLNTIELAITEFGGSGVVKCAISGNVNVSAIISAF